jgi:hypothetical protein
MRERQVQQSCARACCHCLQGLLTADPTLADGFKRTRFLVLDEADRLLEPTFQVRTCTEFWVWVLGADEADRLVEPTFQVCHLLPVFTGILYNGNLSQWSSTAADDMPSAMPTVRGCQ